MLQRLGSGAAIALAFTCTAPSLPLAQTQERPSAPAAGATSLSQTNPEVARECLGDLRAFAERASEDQFWISGWGGTLGYGVRAPTTEGGTGDPWSGAGGPLVGAAAPRYQIETLYRAAYVLGRQGEEQGCEYVLAQLSQLYDGYTSQLEQAGIDPEDVTSWRQERLVGAAPIGQLPQGSPFTVEDITGTDVRNLQDENLGSVANVILDPASGAIRYAIVARGGFLGLGEEYVSVPWDRFLATPGLNTLVLNVDASVVEQAPALESENSVAEDEWSRIDAYWSQQGR